MNNQTFNIHWRLIEDFPAKSGEYLICYKLRDGSYGDLDWLYYSAKEGWDDTGIPEFPSFWTEIPLPRE
jgi:hypothetical protein